MKSLLLYMGNKNTKMDQAVLDILSSLDFQILTQDQKSYYKSLRGLVEHILFGNTLFLQTLAEVFPEKSLPKHDLSAMDQMSFHDLGQTLLQSDHDFLLFIEGLVSAQEELKTMDFHGQTLHISEFLLKWYAHGIHHRGQISQILDSLGIENNWTMLS